MRAYLGHKNIQHTAPYTELSPDRLKDFWVNRTVAIRRALKCWSMVSDSGDEDAGTPFRGKHLRRKAMHELMMVLVATLLGLFLAHEIWSIGSLILSWLTGDPDRIDTMDDLGHW
jgi:hypothetical protein